MSGLQTYYAHHAFGFWLITILVLLGVTLWLTYATVIQQRARAHYDEILHAVDADNVPMMLTEYLGTVRAVSRQTEEMAQRVNYLYESLPKQLCHVGLVRFSPFHDTGGDQSFSMALMDGQGNGVVISALHSRQQHKLYAKPLAGRTSTYSLTEEERRAISESVALEVGSGA